MSEKIIQHSGRQLLDMQAPEIVHHLLYQPALLGYQLGFERPAAGESIVRQHPLAEAMNGKNRGAVKAQNGVIETPQAQFRIYAAFRQ